MSHYLTIPENFSSEEYYRFNKLNKIIQKTILHKGKELTVLDLGCGDGQFLKYLIENLPAGIHCNCIGVDKYVVKKAFEFKLLNDDIENEINVSDHSVDIIIAAEIIEHIKKTDNLIKEMMRVLKEDGDVFITTPNLSSYLNRFLLLFGYQPYHTEVSDIESGLGQGLIYKVLGRSKYNNRTAGHLRLFTFRAFRDFVMYYKFRLINYYPVFFSDYRPDNKRILIIKSFFLIDRFICKIFPKLANGMIYHLRK